jgi:hypothetical protein
MWASVLLYRFQPLFVYIHIRMDKNGGGDRIRTCVALRAADLQSAPIGLSGTPPRHRSNSPRRDSNPSTYRLQIGCATIAPLGHLKMRYNVKVYQIHSEKATGAARGARLHSLYIQALVDGNQSLWSSVTQSRLSSGIR